MPHTPRPKAHAALSRYDTDAEDGVALLLALFVIALATILVFDFGRQSRFDQRASRAFAESIQADYMLKSGVNLGRLLIEAPKLEKIQEDWLGEPWALIASLPSLPISGFVGQPQLMIVDEDGKIDINAINSSAGFPSNPYPPIDPTNPSGGAGQPTSGNPAADQGLHWKNVLRELFEQTGFVREQYDTNLHRTIGSTAYGAADQVAVIADWIDADKNSFQSQAFEGRGIESGAPDGIFLNRPLRSISELAQVPGMTLDRIARIAPFVRVPPSGAASQKININTAPLEVLTALGFPETQALEIMRERTNLPITQEILGTLTTGDPQLQAHTKVSSNEFSIICRVIMPNSTRWVRAVVSAQGIAKRTTQIRSIEFY